MANAPIGIIPKETIPIMTLIACSNREGRVFSSDFHCPRNHVYSAMIPAARPILYPKLVFL